MDMLISPQITRSRVTCSMCGNVFDPDNQSSCQGCPLQKGCQLVRCPACGFEMVDPEQSFLARWAKRLFRMDDAAPGTKKTL